MVNYKYLTGIFILAVFMLPLACSDSEQNETSKLEKAGNEHHHSENEMQDVIYYTCPMKEHKHVSSDKPGKCTECQMALVAAVESKTDSTDYYGCPMKSHSHIRSDKPGVCPDCGMDLKSVPVDPGWGFKSPLRYNKNKGLRQML